MPGVRCPSCQTQGKETWVIPGKNCHVRSSQTNYRRSLGNPRIFWLSTRNVGRQVSEGNTGKAKDMISRLGPTVAQGSWEMLAGAGLYVIKKVLDGER
ncbi:hypothetical protein V8F44DRAFT_599001 [Aspergillus fumigatus]